MKLEPKVGAQDSLHQARRRRPATAAVAACLLGLAAVAVPVVTAQEAPEGAGPEFESATDEQQLEMLRKLLGVEAPAPEPEPAAEPAPVPVQARPEPAAKPAPKPKPAVAPAPKPKPAPRPAVQKAPEPKPAPVPKPKPAAKPAPKPKPAPAAKPAPKPAPRPKPVPAPAPPPRREPPVQEAEAPADEKATDTEETAAVDEGVPPPGTVITAENLETWKEVVSPAMRWSVQRGVKMEVIPAVPIPMEPARAEATERYHAQVRLTEDRKGLLNHVAGLPFPNLSEDDPDVAIKLMFNFEQRTVIDDVNGIDFGCRTGSIEPTTGFEAERNYRIGHFRRLYHQGRIFVDPKPLWKTPEMIRYRETLGPLYEPFDLKGAGFTYNRYLDHTRQDDSWLYFPQQKRVRRLSTAQRSEGIFGQDVDLDSYNGFAGNPAWFDWKLLGKKKVLQSLHSRNEPTKWSDKPADFMFDDVWEARDTYIIAARSLLPGYNFSLRVIYLDAQSYWLPMTEVYDHAGQLWRAYIQLMKASTHPMDRNTESVYPHEAVWVKGLSVFDMQQMHVTFCNFPDFETEESNQVWWYWQGDGPYGSQPEDFDVASMILQGR